MNPYDRRIPSEDLVLENLSEFLSQSVQIGIIADNGQVTNHRR